MRKWHERNGIYRTPKTWALFVCLLAALCLCPAALAIDPIDEDAACSLTVEYTDGDGATMRLYRVGDMTGFGDFTASGAFSGIPYALNGLENGEWDALAYQLKSYADSRSPIISPIAVRTVANGKASFEGLACGLYLLTTDIHEHNGEFHINKPALVSLPNHSDPKNPDAWSYQVLIKTKPGTFDSDTLKVRKSWVGECVGEFLPSVEIELYVNGRYAETVVLHRKNNWNDAFKTVIRSGQDLSVREAHVPEGYTDSISLSTDGTHIWVTVTNQKIKPALVPDQELPKTGQLWWPVPVLAVSGMVLFGLGWARRRRHE